MMTISQSCVDLVKRWEGFSAKPYVCPAGKWTIGYGHTAGVSAGSAPISEEHAEAQLRAELNLLGNEVQKVLTAHVGQGQLDALVAFTYNVGLGAFRSSTLLRKLNVGDYVGAAAEFSRWTKGPNGPLPGLVRRRAAERALFEGVWA